ncbi:MAG: hypothetical protein IH961_08695, partial [Chloroflexi bacterium]|nr:hypothetical protein [Chloroflexota bacterium]
FHRLPEGGRERVRERAFDVSAYEDRITLPERSAEGGDRSRQVGVLFGMKLEGATSERYQPARTGALGRMEEACSIVDLVVAPGVPMGLVGRADLTPLVDGEPMGIEAARDRWEELLR